jgi:hypothetical protein
VPGRIEDGVREHLTDRRDDQRDRTDQWHLGDR